MKAQMIQVWHTVEGRFGETDLLFSFDYTPACRGDRDTYGQSMEPDSPARMEFLDATDEDGKEHEVASPDVDAARERAFAEVAGEYDPDADRDERDWSME